MWKTLAQAFTTLVLAPIAIAGYQVQVSKVTDFATSFHRVAILPATGPDGIDPLWIEQLLFQKLAARQVPVVGSAQVRQALFDIGATSPAPEHLSFLLQSFGSTLSLKRPSDQPAATRTEQWPQPFTAPAAS